MDLLFRDVFASLSINSSFLIILHFFAPPSLDKNTPSTFGLVGISLYKNTNSLFFFKEKNNDTLSFCVYKLIILKKLLNVQSVIRYFQKLTSSFRYPRNEIKPFCSDSWLINLIILWWIFIFQILLYLLFILYIQKCVKDDIIFIHIKNN